MKVNVEGDENITNKGGYEHCRLPGRVVMQTVCC